MTRSIAALVAVVSLAGAGQAVAQESTAPGAVVVTVIPAGGTFFTQGKDTKEPSFGNYGLGGAVGVSINRWEPENALATLRTGLIDAVQVIYNVFDQAPEDELFPVCRELGVAVIARVPFDEGSLTGNLTRESRFPAGDFRSIYFGPENLGPTMDRVDALRSLVPDGSTLPEVALRFILANPDVATVIPGMRRPAHVQANIRASDLGPLDAGLVAQLRAHRWVRQPTSWSL